MKTFTTYAEKKAKQILNLLQGYTKGIRLTAILILLLIGVSNAWANSGAIYGVYFTYDHNGANASSDGTATIDLGTLTSDFKITSVYLKVWDDWGDNKKWEDGQLCYTLDNWGTTKYHGQGKWTKSGKSGNNWELQNSNFNKTIASTSDASGKYTMKYYWQVWGDNTNSYLNNNGNNYTFKWTINPPAVNNFTVTATGQISGSGTSDDPYIIASGQSLTLNLSGSQAHTDANSSLQYNTSGTWDTTTSRTISNITSTDAQSVTVKMRCRNSSASLSGTESSKTIYYKAATYNVAGTMNDWDTSPSNSMTITGAGDIAESTIHLNAGAYEFKIVDNGTWHTMKLTPKDIYRTSNTDVVFSEKGGNNNNTWLHADATGNYTFQYNITNKTLTVIYPELQYYLVGDFGSGWDSEGVQFVDGKVTKTLTKRERPEYTFKVKASNGKHYTAVNKEMLLFTRQHTTEVISDNTDYNSEPYYNLSLQADMDGEYTFEFDPATFKLTVTHPEYSPKAAYLVGDFSDGEAGITDPDNPGKDWTEEYGETFDSNDDCTHGVVEVCDWGEENVTLNFKIKINGIWYGFYHEEDADPLNITTSGTYTLEDQYAYLSASNVQLTTNGEDGCYYFEYTLNGNGTLSVLIIFPNDTRTVTFNMQGHGTQVDEQHVLYNQTAVKPYVSDVDGYLFAGWYTDAACTKEYDFNTPVTQDITLYAKWIPYGDCIFYKNNLNWDEVYVYFYSSDKYWTDDKGTGANKQSEFPMSSNHRPHYRKFRGKMTRIGLTDIWYFDYISAAKRIDPTNWEQIKDHTDNADNDINYSNIAFTAHEQYDHSFFDNTKVIRRGDFKPDMQLFIPQTDQTPTYLNKHDGVSAKYYNKGLWLKYNSTESGYNWSSNVGNWDNNTNYFTSEIAGGYSFTAEVELNASSTYQFKIHNQNGTWYGNPGTMTQDNCTNWWFKEEVNNNAQIQPTVTGTYIFTAYLGDGKVMISLDYPLSTGDYRLAYKDNQAGSFHPGHYIKKRTTVEEKRDTVSFFVVHDEAPEIQLQECTDITEGIATWETKATYNDINSIATATTVYNFILKQTNIDGTHARSVETSETHLYTGDYYIRTDAAAGGWKSFRQEGNKMTYSSYADEHEDFNHYFCEWVSQEKGLKNVSYTVANDYSYCISDTLHDDVDTNHPIIVSNNDLDKKGNLPVKNGTLIDANVRFGWDSKTNKLRRAYIAGSGHKKDRFLVLEGNASLLDINGKRFTGNTAEGQDRYNLTDDEVVFDDMGNWIYQMDVKANKDTKIDLTAKYNNLVQYFKGGSKDEDEILLIVTTNDNEKYYKIRIIYDFKTNHLISAWLPEDETITTDEQLGADMMIIRHNQEKAEQLNFNPLSSSLTKVGTAYAVMTFDKYFLNNKDKTGNELAEKKSENERKFYWISFPFDVKLSEVFGFGEYGDQWIMEYYDGEARAKEGYWAETETFWKYITNKNYVLKAGQGYVLCLNLNKMGFTSTVFAHTTEVSLYFPSTGPLNTITGELPTAVTVPAHECTIERDNRNIYDSNWNLIGVPGFADIEEVTIGGSSHTEFNDDINADCVSFYYKYLPATNKYDATNNEENFQTMYAYMVQFAGTINWRAKTMPAQLAARRTGSMPSQHDLRLEIAQGEQTDQTFVQLKEEDATAEFDMNVDMTKIFNSGMNIYTLTGSNAIQVAGNALPIAKATIPVGVVTATAGEYTFRMPDGTDGIAVTLVDNVTGTHTNMLMNEYTVTLNAGTIENRFYLMVDPDRTATSVENIGEEAKGEEAKGQIKKFLIDGKLFIRTTNGIFDAKGQRL